MKKIIFLALTGLAAMLFTACYYDKEQLLLPPKTGTGTCLNYSFTTDVLPIVQTSCSNGTGCHGAGSTNGPGELITYNEIKNSATQIAASVSAGRMPLGSTLSADQIQIISCWVANGTLNN